MLPLLAGYKNKHNISFILFTKLNDYLLVIFIMTDSDPVVIDDDNDVIIQFDNNANHKNKQRMDMIVIDDVEDLTQNEITDIIEIDDEPDLRNKINQLKYLCDRTYRENKYLKIFVEKCLDLESTDGMLRVINRTLLRGYRETTNAFKNSPELDNTLKKAIDLIEADPGHKFSHVKFVCEVFKKHKFRKKVDFVTLTPYLKGSVENKLKRPNNKISSMTKKRKADIIIDVDTPMIYEVPIINLEEDENLLIRINDKPMTETILEIENSNKENHFNCEEDKATNTSEENKNIEASNNENITSLSEVTSNTDGSNIPNSQSSEQGKGDVSNQLLVPQRDEQYKGPAFDDNVMEQVKQIEQEIAFYKDKIATLEGEEVLENTTNSPYIRCDRMKAEITKRYQKLCLLTGEEPVKRYEVHLDVVDGHPSGPVRELEQFINDNIGKNGEPPFPDFTDVVNCVIRANRSDGLGWKTPQIMREANLLFVQCGRALQKRRQRREWRDMLYQVKHKTLDYDPADEDPDLQARLEQNRRIALGKEADLLQRFASMENDPNLIFQNDSDDYFSDNEDQHPIKDLQQAPNIHNAPSTTTTTAAPKKTNETISCLIYTHRVSKDCTNNISDNSHKSIASGIDLMNDVAKTTVKSEFCDNSNILDINNPIIYSEIPKEDTDIKENEESILTNNIPNAIDDPILESSERKDKTNVKQQPFPESSVTEDTTNDKQQPFPESSVTEDKTNVKQEPVDIAMLLEELGDNFTSTIIDIEDPFLVIEISSDSSDCESDHES